MIPDNELSVEPVPSEFFVPNRTDLLVDYELGGIAVGDASQGLQAKLWTCYYEDKKIKVKADGVSPITWLTLSDVVTHLSFSFDQNMRPCVVYIMNGSCYFWWYDSNQQQQTTTEYGSTFEYPQLSLDDKRAFASGDSDVVLAYIKNKKLCMRIQRDRYLTEYELGDAETLVQIGMMKNSRFGFSMYNIVSE